jgi:hypothetical protein
MVTLPVLEITHKLFCLFQSWQLQLGTRSAQCLMQQETVDHFNMQAVIYVTEL